MNYVLPLSEWVRILSENCFRVICCMRRAAFRSCVLFDIDDTEEVSELMLSSCSKDCEEFFRSTEAGVLIGSDFSCFSSSAAGSLAS